jgi:succinate dehydrogenase / fumarate reductase cytochrome b subunit
MRISSGKPQPNNKQGNASKSGNLRHKTVVIDRPKNLKLSTIRLPLPALISILHRASGVILFLVIPVFIWALQTSLLSDTGYQSLQNLMQCWLVKLMLLGIAWAFIHHFLAGLRHLAHDAHWWEGLMQARVTSKLVLALSLVLTMVIGVKLW